MSNPRLPFLRFLASIAFAVVPATANTAPVAGLWQQMDGQTHQPSATIALTEEKGVVQGVILTLYPGADEPADPRCARCAGADKNAPVKGMRIVRDMRCTASACDGGTILDPESGKIYHATLALENNGATLRVRGYVGLPLLGRTEIWRRVTRP